MIRFATETDAADIQAIYAPYILHAATSFELVPPAVPEMGERIRSISSRWPWLVAEVNGAVAGYAYGSEHSSRAAYRWSVNVAIYLHADHHRKGIGRALYSTLFSILRLQGFVNAYAGVTLPNAGSVGLHEAMGFQPVGIYRAVGYKFGAWHDVGWWHLKLAALPAMPAEPRTVDQIPDVELRRILDAVK